MVAGQVTRQAVESQEAQVVVRRGADTAVPGQEACRAMPGPELAPSLELPLSLGQPLPRSPCRGRSLGAIVGRGLLQGRRPISLLCRLHPPGRGGSLGRQAAPASPAGLRQT